MQDNLDYQRGLENARVDAKQGWARCWLPAQELAEQAVYSAFGLSAEELGYAAGLDEAFPGGLREISGFLDQLQLPGTPIPSHPGEQDASETPVRPVDALATVVFGPCCADKGSQGGYSRQLGSVFMIYRRLGEREKWGQKKLFLAQFVCLYTYAVPH